MVNAHKMCILQYRLFLSDPLKSQRLTYVLLLSAWRESQGLE